MAITTDALIVGAGPCGLFQVFELGLLGIEAHVVDALPYAGGQCAELYPNKPIYDIPAVPVCSGIELVDQLHRQIEPFEPVYHLSETVSEVEVLNDLEFAVKTSAGTEFVTKSIIIAGGVGSFEPQLLRVDGVEELVNRNVFYRVLVPERFEDRDIVILGGGDSAFDWTLELVDLAKSVLMVHRSENFRAADDSIQKMRALQACGKLDFMVGNVNQLYTEDNSLRAIDIIKPDSSVKNVELEDLLVFFGLSPKLGPIANWGLEITRNQIHTDTEKFETNIPGIYAIGDIATYPGKKKLILSGFHEAALAAFAIKARLNPGEKVHLQYTTTSPIMQERLGVGGT